MDRDTVSARLAGLSSAKRGLPGAETQMPAARFVCVNEPYHAGNHVSVDREEMSRILAELESLSDEEATESVKA